MMATRTIFRKGRSLVNAWNNSGCAFHSFSGFGYGQLSYARSSFVSHWAVVPFVDTDSRGQRESFSITKDKLQLSPDVGLLQENMSVNPALRLVGASPFYRSSLRPTSLSLSLCYYCTPSGQPEFPTGRRTKEESVTESKEPSPEECDEAVQGLSLIKDKAKAKAKEMKESLKSKKTRLQRVCAKLLGIAPALRVVASMGRKDWANKLCHWKDEFKSTLQHYWWGMKLLWADTRISSRLLLKLARGKSLSRRERQQLTRTTADIFRLVPFAVFIVVPFMEFLLPVFLKLFPNMLPSTFKDKMKEQEELKKRLHARIEMAKFLQDTVKEMAKEVQNSRSGEIKKTAEDLDEFINKVRRGEDVSNEEILAFAKLFNDELTLDNMSRPRLVNMCKYMGIRPFGNDAYLRFMLYDKLRKITEDDEMIQAEGVESLSEEELHQACRERGMIGSLSAEEMRQQLRDWLDLSLTHFVPSSLLILSRAFCVAGKIKPEEAVEAVEAAISSLPVEVVESLGATSLPSEDPLSERRRKLEFLEMQEELIKEEEMVNPTAKEAEERAKAELLDKDDQLCGLSRALAVLASASSMSQERKEFLRLVNKEIELYTSVVDKEGIEREAEAKMAYKAAREVKEDEAKTSPVTSALIDRVDKMLLKLERDIDDVDTKIWRLLDKDGDGKVTEEEVASAAAHLKDTLDKNGLQELISKLSKDKDGKIHIKDLVKLASQRKDNDEAESDP